MQRRQIRRLVQEILGQASEISHVHKIETIRETARLYGITSLLSMYLADRFEGRTLEDLDSAELGKTYVFLLTAKCLIRESDELQLSNLLDGS